MKNRQAVKHKTGEEAYVMPEESALHEGTWLQWPHHYQYGYAYRNNLDATWVEMTRALVSSENVHIIVYDQAEKDRVVHLLKQNKVPLSNIDFSLYETDDTWIRDNGPIYVRNKNGELVIEDWGFNAWGNKTDDITGLPIRWEKCDVIPSRIARDQETQCIDLNAVMINEGGSVEIDGNGTLMACKSSVLNKNRNPGMTQAQAEQIFRQYLGVSHFIWLEGRAGLEITDQHIDGFARFGNEKTIVTMNEEDLIEFEVRPSDIKTLFSAYNKSKDPYDFLFLPLTERNVRTAEGKNLGYKGSYVNYYIANTTVLVPHYEDPSDTIAQSLIQELYPSRKVVGIDVRNLYAYGGMIHCVTQQQPAD